VSRAAGVCVGGQEEGRKGRYKGGKESKFVSTASNGQAFMYELRKAFKGLSPLSSGVLAAFVDLTSSLSSSFR
jgi:hypothetical protein